MKRLTLGPPRRTSGGWSGPSGDLGPPPSGNSLPPADEDDTPSQPRLIRHAVGDIDAAARIYAASFHAAMAYPAQGVPLSERACTARVIAGVAVQDFIHLLDSEINPND